MIKLNNYNNFINESNDDIKDDVINEDVDSIDELFKKLKETLKKRHEKIVEIENIKDVDKDKDINNTIDNDENYYKGTIKQDVDNIKKQLNDKSQEELTEYSIKCANLISQTEKKIQRLKSKVSDKDNNLSNKLDIYNKNIKILKDLKTYIDKKYSK